MALVSKSESVVLWVLLEDQTNFEMLTSSSGIIVMKELMHHPLLDMVILKVSEKLRPHNVHLKMFK